MVRCEFTNSLQMRNAPTRPLKYQISNEFPPQPQQAKRKATAPIIIPLLPHCHSPRVRDYTFLQELR